MRIRKRILMECRYLISLKKSYRELARIFNVSPSTVCIDLNDRLFNIDKDLYYRVKSIVTK